MSTVAPQAPRLGGPANGRKVSPKVSPPCSKRLRSDLLNKLGIVDERSHAPPPGILAPLKAADKSVLGPIKIVKAPLKKDEGPDPRAKASQGILVTLGSFFRVGSPASSEAATISTASLSESDDASTISSASERRRGLTFDEEVSVVHIPRRDQYSNRLRQHLWHSPESLHANIARNTIEYAADGWKWQDVREEEEHVLCRESGEHIHPVHAEIARMIRQDQGLPEATPVWTPFLKHSPVGVCTTVPVPQED